MTLEIREVSLALGGHPVLSDVSFRVDAGEFVGLLGANGSGKTSTLRCLYGSLRPDRGEILLDDRPLESRSRREVAQQIAVMTQDTGGGWDYTVEETVELGRTPHKAMFERTTSADRTIVEDALAAVDALSLRHRPVARLSGGERQRVMLARVLAQEPQVLLLDEPTNHLDVRFQIDLLQRVRALGRTTVAVLHDLNLAAAFCDRLVLMRDGRVLADGPTAQVLTADTVNAAYRISCRIDHLEDGIVVRYWPARPVSTREGQR
ncbi:MAG: ABC transporter ATP-binding protein [Thermomicrobiales bacterium]|nr:ABC transporter ATP-binding protein [Thermomicrobiales bacterium]MCO5223099.1 ABC transporter ATP-binding protein [Thermomicrobiales bacterium]